MPDNPVELLKFIQEVQHFLIQTRNPRSTILVTCLYVFINSYFLTNSFRQAVCHHTRALPAGIAKKYFSHFCGGSTGTDRVRKYLCCIV